MSGSGWRRLVGAIFASLCLFVAAPALATTVLLVRPAGAGAVTSEALVRIHGELVANGFDVELATAEAVDEVRTAFARGRRTPGPDAVLSVVGEDAPTAIEVWVGEPAHGRSLTNRTPLGSASERVPAVLAIRAIELLRSSLLEVSLAKPAPVPASPPPPPLDAAAPRPSPGLVTPAAAPRDDSAWAIEVGGGVSFSANGVGPALLPIVRLDRVVASFCIAQVSVAGLGSRSHVAAPPASAEVAEQFALLGATFRWPTPRRLRPMASLAVGVLHTEVEGQADWPYRDRSASQWSFLADLGVGVGVVLARRYELSLGAHAQVAEPYPVVSFLHTDVASGGRPTILFTLALVAWL